MSAAHDVMPTGQLPPLKKKPRTLPKLPSPLKKKKKKNVVAPCATAQIEDFNPSSYYGFDPGINTTTCRRQLDNGFDIYNPHNDSISMGSCEAGPPIPRYPSNQKNTAEHFINAAVQNVDPKKVGEYMPRFAFDRFRQIFDMYDKNGDNVINVEELRGILEILGYSPTPEEVKTILERFDQDKSGTIDFDEYLVLIQHWIEQDEEQIYEAFKVFDKDGDGFVSAQELKRALTQYGEQFTEEEANEFFNMMDTDGDGVINYEEFVEYLRSMQKYSTE